MAERLTVTDDEIDELFDEIQAGGEPASAPSQAESDELADEIAGGGTPTRRRRRSGGPLRRRLPRGVPEELEISPGERAGRLGRIVPGEAVGPGGLGGLLGGAANIAQRAGELTNPGVALADAVQRKKFGIQDEASLGDLITEGSGVLQNAIQGDVVPSDRSERFAGKFSQEAAASAAVATPVRAFAKAKTAIGAMGPGVNRFIRAMGNETPIQFALGEFLSVTGAAGGRMLTEGGGPAAEIGGALFGDLTLRTLPRKSKDAVVKIARYLKSVKFEGPTKQQQRILDEILVPIREAGGLDVWLRDPKNQAIFDAAAEKLVRFAGQEDNARAAAELMKEVDRIAIELNVNPDDLVAGFMSGNPGLATITEMALARDPAGAINIQAATLRGNRALAKTLAEAGVPKSVPQGNVPAVKASVREEVERELNRVTAEVDEIKSVRQAEVNAADEAATGQLTSPGAAEGIADQDIATDLRFDASSTFAQAREAARLRVKTRIIDPLYEEARRISDENSNVKFGVTGSKDALARVKKPLRDAGMSEAPTKFFGFIEALDNNGVTFAVLQDLRKTLGNAAKKLKKAEDFDGAEMLDELRRGVISDIENYEIITLAEARAGAGADSSIGVIDRNSRRMVSEKMDEANAAARALAEEFYEGTSGRIFKALRTKNPVALSHQMGMFLKHTGPGYPERVKELARIARGNEALGIAPSPALVNNITDWLVADAYSRTVKLVKQSDGTFVRRLDRKALDTWKKNNSKALQEFGEAKRVTDNAEELVERARRLQAEPMADVAAVNLVALERFVDDPQNFWTEIAGFGPEKGKDAVDQLAQTVSKSGDTAAWAGLKESLWSSRWAREFTAEPGRGVSPEQAMNAIGEVLDTPQLRHAVETIYGPQHVRLLEKARKIKGVLVDGGAVSRRVQPLQMDTGIEAAENFVTDTSFMSVIYGFKRRLVKAGTAIDRFARSMNKIQSTALIMEAANNPPLLAETLTRAPTDKIIKSIRTRMNLAFPTLFERVPARAELSEERKEAQRKRGEQRALGQEPANRGILSTPSASRSIVNPALQ